MRLSKVSNTSGEIASYQYDPFGRRISKTINGKSIYYIYGSDELIAEQDQNGKMWVMFDWKPDSGWVASLLWQANLGESQTLKPAIIT
ncbi:RHS repeat domain-containing protein [Snodgrassella sp.]|uniref:RHS repeat domain-containing protein n=1 Tax=Snodgrassella sp. TaxID=2815304 RepID=UPI00258C7FBA|nr:RHS repeat domain-containing protein [Snodgrassella sp.]